MSQSVLMSHSVCVMHVFLLSVCLQTQSVVMSHSICMIHVFSHSVSCNDTDCCCPKLNPKTQFIRGDQGFQYKCDCHGTKCTYTKFLVSTRLAEQYMFDTMVCAKVFLGTRTHTYGMVLTHKLMVISILIVYSRYTWLYFWGKIWDRTRWLVLYYSRVEHEYLCCVRKYYFSITSKGLLRSAGDINPEEMASCVSGVSVNEETG